MRTDELGLEEDLESAFEPGLPETVQRHAALVEFSWHDSAARTEHLFNNTNELEHKQKAKYTTSTTGT